MIACPVCLYVSLFWFATFLKCSSRHELIHNLSVMVFKTWIDSWPFSHALEYIFQLSFPCRLYILKGGTEKMIIFLRKLFFQKTFFFRIFLISKGFLAMSQLRICIPPSPPLPQFWSHFHERCAMCWTHEKNDFKIPIFIFRVIKNSSKIGVITLQKWP